MSEDANIALIGGGSWATALAKIILDNGRPLNWYILNPDTMNAIQKTGRNPRYLSSVVFNTSGIQFFSDINAVVENSDILLIATPTAFIDLWLKGLSVSLKDKFILSAVKGLLPGEHLTMTEYFNQKYNIPFDRMGVISGPSHAEEISLERTSMLTIATKHRQDAELLSHFFDCRYVHTILSDDIYGIEYAGVLKNIFAVASGICHGLGYGDNFQAVLVANAFKEMRQFLNDSYSHQRDLSQSVYLGDLLVTAYSQFSRNRIFGSMIGKGYSVKFAQLEMQQVAEGYYAVEGIHEINKKHKVDMPIMEAVYHIIYENITPVIEMKILAEKLK